MAIFGKKMFSDIPPAPIEYKPEPKEEPKAEPQPEPKAEPLPELDFLKQPPVSQQAPAPAAEYSGEPVIKKQSQYNRLILETEMPPVITVCRYGSNYVATDHVRNLQAVERTEYEALEALLKQYRK